MTKDLVSVILPIYNMQDYLERSIDSILNQTYQNIEIILVNDGSSDNSLKICNSYKLKDDRIIVIDKENGGPSSARNAGIMYASGKWIMFVDPDDYVDKKIIEVLIKNVSEKTDIISCSCFVELQEKKLECEFFYENITANNISEKQEFFKQLLDYKYGQKKNIFTAIGVPWGKLYKTDFLKKEKILFDDRLRRMQDNIFNMYAFYYAKEIKYINVPLYYYNFDHMSKLLKDYKFKDVEIEHNKAVCRQEVMSRLNLLDNEDLYKFYFNEQSMFLFRIIKIISLTKDINGKFKNKIKLFNDFHNNTLYKDLLNNVNLITSKKERLIIYLFKKKSYYLIHCLFKLYTLFK